MNSLSDQIEMNDINMFKKPKQIECPKCKCTWFEVKKFQQIDTTTAIPPTSEPPATGHKLGAIYMLKCAKCGEMYETPHDELDSHVRDEYDSFISIFEKEEGKQK